MEEKNEEIKYCPECGEANQNNSSYCWKCGYNLNQNPNNEESETINNLLEEKSDRTNISLIIFGVLFVLIVVFLVVIMPILNNEKLYDEAKKAFDEKDINTAKEIALKLPDNISKYAAVKNEIIEYEEEELYKNIVDFLAKNDLSNAIQNAKQLSTRKDKYKEIKNEVKAKKLIQDGDNAFNIGKYKQAASFYEQSKNIYHIKGITKKIDKANTYYKNQVAELEECFIYAYDEVEAVKSYFDKNIVNYLKKDLIYLRLDVMQNTRVALRFIINHVASESLYWSKMTYNIDGEIFQYELPFGTVKEGDNITETLKAAEQASFWGFDALIPFMSYEFWTHADLNYSDYSSLIHKIINSNKAIIRLSNRNGDTFDREITINEKEAMRRTERYFMYVTKGGI